MKYESGKGSYWQHPSAISFWEQVLSLFLSHSPNHVIPHREQEIKSSVFWELLENWFWEHSKPLQICRKTKDVKTVAFPLCSSSDLRNHMQLYHREQTLDLGGAQAIIPQGKHQMFVQKEGRTFPCSFPERDVFPGILLIVIIVTLPCDNAWLAWHERRGPSFFSEKPLYPVSTVVDRCCVLKYGFKYGWLENQSGID